MNLTDCWAEKMDYWLLLARTRLALSARHHILIIFSLPSCLLAQAAGLLPPPWHAVGKLKGSSTSLFFIAGARAGHY